MAERVAVVGSREGADLLDVTSFLQDLWRKFPYTTLVSGGAAGVDKYAEEMWLQLGGKVLSYRPAQFRPDVWGIEQWDLGGDQPRVFQLVNEPTFENFKSAAIYRDILIAERADRVVSFMRYGGSRGAGFTAEVAEGTYEKPTYRFEARREAA